MKAKNWTKHTNGRPGREIYPIPFGGTMDTFRPKVSEEELKGFTDEHGDIRFYHIFEWMLPLFDGDSFYEFLASRMCNYMLHVIKEKGWEPNYYHPSDEKYILANDVACIFGCQLARSLRGNPSILRCWSTRESLNAIGTCMESMPKNAFGDIYSLLHFNDDWNNGEEWEDKLAPNNNRGMTYQTDEKHLMHLLEYFVGVVKLSCYSLSIPLPTL